MATIKIEDMLGYEQDWNLEINTKSVDIENTLNGVYKFIVKYFNENDKDDSEYIEETINYVCNLFKKYELEGFSLAEHKCGELKESLLNLKEKSKAIYSVIKGEDTEENKSAFSLILYMIILFSIFDFEENTNLSEIRNITDWQSIFSLEESTYSWFKFKTNNRFFSLLEKITGGEWNNWTISCDPKGLRLNQNGFNLKAVLESGYINHRSGNTYYLFYTRESVFDLIFNILSCAGNSLSFSNEKASFKISGMDKPPVLSLESKILNTFRTIVDYESHKESAVKNAEFGDKNHSISVDFSINDNNDVVSKYIDNIYDYSINLFNSYIEALADSKTAKNADDILNNERVQKLFNKIVGSSSSQKFSKANNWNKSGYISKEGFGAFITNKTKRSINSEYLEISADNIDFKSTTNIFQAGRISINGDTQSRTALKDLYEEYNITTPLQFFELETINNEISNTSLSDLENKIDQLCNNISGNIIAKISYLFFNVYTTEVKSETSFSGSDVKNLKSSSISVLTLPNYKIIKRYQYETNATFLKINGTSYKTFEEVYEKLSALVYKMMYDACSISIKEVSDSTGNENKIKDGSDFTEYIKSRFADGYYTEENFFYIDDGFGRKTAPVNSFIDIEFRIPEYNAEAGGWIERWLPVTAVREYTNKDYDLSYNTGIDELHAGTYFNNMEIEDKGSDGKLITLTLKSVNDINLENIIFYSLAIDEKMKILKNEKGNNDYSKNPENKTAISFSDMNQIIKDSESNFRVRFGYRDRPPYNGSFATTITTSNEYDAEFVNRDKMFFSDDSKEKKTVKPVQVYPWTYFKITGIQSSINDGEDTYTISGVSSGSYILNYLSLAGIQANFAGKTDGMNDNYRGTPKNVVGKLAKWITQASCGNKEDFSEAKIVFLGDERGTLLTGFDNDNGKFNNDWRYQLRGGADKNFRGGNLESIENFFFDSTNSNILTAKNFSLENNSKTYSIKEVLDNLVDWLPNRVYYIAKDESSGKTAAVYTPYEDIYKIPNFFGSNPYKTEKIVYQVIESDAYIYKKGNAPNNISNDMYHKVYFIRMYYEGPGIRTDENDNDKNYGEKYLRVYNYRSVQNQVIENISIDSNDAELGNLISSVTLLGAETPVVFIYNKLTNEIDENIISQSNGGTAKHEDITGKVSSNNNSRIKEVSSYDTYFKGKPEDDSTPRLVLNNSKYILFEQSDSDIAKVSISNKLEEASSFFTDQMNKEYTGEMTIMGDPFYYFDSTVEAGKYEIFLQMNRSSSIKSYKLKESKYTGIYFIKGIKQAIDEFGKYTTTLSIVKRIFGNSSKNSNN